ncbi:PH (Pleckstrin Homology) domain-containing protein [Chryseobacterium sp. 7]|uniref:PH domain-containing protein n=1 Tax=Chryseobacterium sp. 7 TaxID=2035214 RepID=UPI000EAF9BD3|nr:PH domain-containing protein [Chryseobacterium sp. 7]RLJ30665.1 PH (Pleckstrin Homology) domain-containing protein [Chryseobacterium sp. 7]
MKNLLATSKAATPNIYYTAKIHWISLIIPSFLILIGPVGVISFLLLGFKYMIGFLGLISLFLIYIFIRGLIRLLTKRNTKIYVTDNYLTFSTGILGRTFFDLPLNKIEGIGMHQSYLGKLLDFGTLVATTGSETHTYVIKHPQELRNVIFMLRDNSAK